MSEWGYRRFNAGLVGFVVVVCLVGVANWRVDPYSFWATPTVEGFSEAKPARGGRDRLAVVGEVLAERPTGVILGTSTARKLDTDRFEELTGATAVNMGLPNATTREMRAYFDFALRMEPDLEVVLVGADFFSFNANKADAPTFSASFLEGNPYLTDEAASTLLSWDALRDSYETVRENRRLASAEATADVRTGGGSSRIVAFREYLPVVMADRELYFGYEPSASAIEDVRHIADVCAERGIDLVVVVTPMHAVHLDALYDAGLGDEYAAWLRSLATVHPVWDLSGYTELTTTAITDDMTDYRDPLHFTRAIGTQIIDAVVGDDRSVFGAEYRVTSDDIEAHLADLERDRDVWLASDAYRLAVEVLEGEGE